jgi:hypothetical protein
VYNQDYIGYKKIGDIFTSGANAASTITSAYEKGGLDPAADIAAALASASFLSNLVDQWTSHPAADARDFIANHKPIIASLDPYNRIKKVIVFNSQINPKAIDVAAREWLLWYKTNYFEDYKQLEPAVKLYWNKYLDSVIASNQDGNNMYANARAAKFTTSEINYNATPTQSAANIFSSATSGTINWVLYGAIAIGAIYLIKNIRK